MKPSKKFVEVDVDAAHGVGRRNDISLNAGETRYN